MRVLWIGAHPDDELFVAPYLGYLIEEKHATCGFLVATRGEQGPCYRPQGCEPDLATVREQEMRDAAAVFGGECWFADCRDGSALTETAVLGEWAADAGGEAKLLERFRERVEAFAPDLILAFDGRNGATGHADHRAAGIVVQRLGLSIPTKLLESRFNWRAPLEVTPALPDADRFDAAAYWEWLIRDISCHRSQFGPTAVEMFASAPSDQRIVWLSNA